MQTKKIISDNQKTWDTVAESFLHATCLPCWGPFDAGNDLNLIPKIKGKTFLEIGCGSGRSIKYLIQKGAKKVFGLDLSVNQIRESTQYNQTEINSKKVELFQGPMEKKIKIDPVDCVCSVYAIGWTPDPAKTFKNVYSYLKPGGTFIWSWDHTFFSNIQYKNKKFVLTYGYHDENPLALKDWKTKGTIAHLTYRKTSSWFKFLREAGFNVIGYHEPKPNNLNRGSDDPTRYYSIQKAQKIPCTMIFVCQKPN